MINNYIMIELYIAICLFGVGMFFKNSKENMKVENFSKNNIQENISNNTISSTSTPNSQTKNIKKKKNFLKILKKKKL